MVMKKALTVLVAATAMAGLGIQGTANAAPTGWPEGCWTWTVPETNGRAANCSSPNGGSWRASATCQPYDGAPAITWDATSWTKSGMSMAFCPPLTYVTGGTFWTRSY
ncbi:MULTISPECIES: hypothetical protein [unclassified Streptomyces]|uniref:hypothetical protein n=1 Tax=unclassified Streptomyces TaxID=2593676 RepID=UPI0033E7EFA9